MLCEPMEAAKRLPADKAPGPDGVHNEVTRVIVETESDVLLGMYYACLWEKAFPEDWKVAWLVLANKGGGKPVTVPSSYRPLCMVNNVTKLLERLILVRFSKAVAANGGLSDSQYGFRPGRGTIQAIREVLEMADAAASGAFQDRDWCLLAVLDVRNAFNSAPWTAIDEAVRQKCMPAYMISILRSYIVGQGGDGERQLNADKDRGPLWGPTRLGSWAGLVELVLRRPADTTPPTESEIDRVCRRRGVYFLFWTYLLLVIIYNEQYDKKN